MERQAVYGAISAAAITGEDSNIGSVYNQSTAKATGELLMDMNYDLSVIKIIFTSPKKIQLLWGPKLCYNFFLRRLSTTVCIPACVSSEKCVCGTSERILGQRN